MALAYLFQLEQLKRSVEVVMAIHPNLEALTVTTFQGLIEVQSTSLELFLTSLVEVPTRLTVGFGYVSSGWVTKIALFRARKGVFITTSSYSNDAMDFVKNIDSKIVLIDGAELSRLMIEYGVGVGVQRVVKVMRLDGDYFEE